MGLVGTSAPLRFEPGFEQELCERSRCTFVNLCIVNIASLIVQQCTCTSLTDQLGIQIGGKYRCGDSCIRMPAEATCTCVSML